MQRPRPNQQDRTRRLITTQLHVHDIKKREHPYSQPGKPKKAAKKLAKPDTNRVCYVLDTNVLIDDPRSPFAFQEHDVVIPLVVFEELDHLKTKLPQARESIRALYELGISEEWIQLESGGRLRAESGRDIPNAVALEDGNDNRIISIAVGLDQKFGPGNKETGRYRDVVLVSNDLNVGVKSRILGLQTELYKTNETRFLIGGEGDVLPKVAFSVKELEAMMKVPAGKNWELSVSSSVRAKLEKAGVVLNSGVLICFDDPEETVQMAAIYKGGHLVRTDAQNGLVWNNGVIKPFVPTYWRERGVNENHEQEVYLHELSDFNTKLVSAYGRAGTGKTLMAVGIGLMQVLGGHYQKLLITKPQVTSGADIGFLPGTKEDKMASWIAPMRDHIVSVHRRIKHSNSHHIVEESASSNQWEGKRQSQRKTSKVAPANKDSVNHSATTTATSGQSGITTDREIFDELIAQGIIEVEATAFVRGRSLEGVYVVIDEGQNLSVDEMKTWVTRMGEGSKLVITGDIEQIDAPYLRKNNNGLAVVAERSKGNPWAFSIHLRYGVRSILSDWAAQNLWMKYILFFEPKISWKEEK